ncbi:hypothetical protein KSP40_PGU021536 [Platanthera guangdongensis]|uniref:QWRF motif-containing protein 3 n=1 Tax=Platanthera guangdongensis TaxID=2320717 RepID=A0ABR2MCN6_9ASPA
MEKGRLLPRTHSGATTAAAGIQLSSPFSENNISPLRRKSISFVPDNNPKNGDDEETPNSPAHPSFLGPPNSLLRRNSNVAITSVPNRKSVADSARRFQKQSCADDFQNRGLWPSSKKLNPSADTDADVASEPLPPDHRRVDAEADLPAAAYKVSTFASRQRDQPSVDRGNRSLRYQIGKLNAERSLKKPGTPPSPSTTGPPPPSAPTHSRRLSFSDAAFERKRTANIGADIPSTESERRENVGQSPRVPRMRSPAKGKSGGVGGLISQGFSNLFRRKSFLDEHVESVAKTKAAPLAAMAVSPGKERAGKAKGSGSPARESISTSRANGTPARGAAAGVEGEKLRMIHNYLIQWRFINAGMVVVNETKKVNAQRMLVSAWAALSESRFSVAKKRAQLEKEKLKFKLNSLLLHQTKGLERWSAVERHHLAALSSTENSLQAAVCRLPITNHAKVDPNSLATSLQQATNVADAINGTIAKNHSRAESTALLVAELAQVVAREKLLLEECIELLGLCSSLHVHEESLRSHVIQIKTEKLMGCMEEGAALQC